MINGQSVEFVQEFRYLGYILSQKMSDDSDIKREIRNMYMRTNMLTQRFKSCPTDVKIRIFRAYCICLYGVPLWSHYNASTFSKLNFCYHKCMKKFFGFRKCYSVTAMLFELGLPSFATVMHNYRHSFIDNGLCTVIRWLFICVAFVLVHFCLQCNFSLLV